MEIMLIYVLIFPFGCFPREKGKKEGRRGREEGGSPCSVRDRRRVTRPVSR